MLCKAVLPLGAVLLLLVLGLVVAMGTTGFGDATVVSVLSAAVGVVLLVVSAVGLVILRLVRGRVGGRAVADEHTVREASSGRAFAVACSGGGLRASAFVLGSINALQTAEESLGLAPVRGPEGSTPTGSDPPGSDEPYLVAVSGGSYTAAAMSLVRVFPAPPSSDIQVGGTPSSTTPASASAHTRTPPLPWTEAFAPDSPETAYLRRHTRDLFEPRRELVSGLLGLVAGAVLNIVILLGVLIAAAWATSAVAAATGVLSVQPAGRRLVVTNPLLLGPSSPHTAWIGWLVVLLLGLGFLATLVLWADRRARDDARSGRAPVSRLTTPAAIVQRWAVGAALGALLLLAALPAAVAALSAAAADNAPTPAIAWVLHEIGFTTPEICQQAAGQSVLDAERRATVDARISPGETREYAAGACGFTATVAITLTSADGTCAADGTVCPQRTDADWKALGAELDTLAGNSGRAGAPSQLAGLAAIAVTVTGLLRAAGTTGSSAGTSSGAVSTLRRLVLGWLPPALIFIVLSWFVLSRMFDTALAPATSPPSLDKMALPLLALVCAAWSDANVTSLHTYYRMRLSNAFAVGRRRDPATTSAQGTGDTLLAGPLDPDVYYRFSQLGAVGLRVATTANVRAYGETPTRRGGVPMTFDGRNVVLQAPGGTLPMADYETAAGLGRTSVMAAVAMSGAAVSPMAGRMAARIAPFRLLLTLLNIRVGVWVSNPLWCTDGPQEAPRSLWGILADWPTAPWLVRRPGAVQVVAEAFGASSVHDRWLYLSDGGHLDNTGMVEAVRALLPLPTGPAATTAARPARRALVIDASNDPEGSWTAVGDALAVVQADLGIRLLRGDEDPLQNADSESLKDGTAAARLPVALPFWWRRRGPVTTREFARIYRTADGRLEVLVVKAVRPADVPTSVLPDSVRAFALTHPDFPRAATARQDFGDLEFEAYRMLGQVYTEKAIAEFWLPSATRREPSRNPGTARSASAGRRPGRTLPRASRRRA